MRGRRWDTGFHRMAGPDRGRGPFVPGWCRSAAGGMIPNPPVAGDVRSSRGFPGRLHSAGGGGIIGEQNDRIGATRERGGLPVITQLRGILRAVAEEELTLAVE